MRKPVKSAPLKAPTSRGREPVRDRHGFRGTPGPATFDLSALPDDGLLTDFEVAAILRVSTNTTAAWRKRGIHLQWFTLPSGQVRSTVGAVKAFLASGKPRARPSPRAAPTEAPPAPPRQRKVACKHRRADRARATASEAALQEQS
jgi:hypothetical protein